MKTQTDLTEGIIWKKLLFQFLPIAAGAAFQLLYNAVDAIIAGRFIGTTALAAVSGTPFTLSMLLINSFVALCGGAAVIIGQTYGAREYEKLSQAVHSSLVFCTCIGVVITALVMVYAEPLLRFFRMPEDSFQDSLIYLRVYFAGAILIILFNMGFSILRAVGNSRLPFIFLVISACVNIVVDLYFVAVLHLGVAGAGYATVLSELVSCILVFRHLLRTEDIYGVRIRELTIHWDVLKEMLKIGIPTGAQTMMYGIANTIMVTAFNMMGTKVVAAWGAFGKLDGVYGCVINAYGITVMTYIAQNFGAGKEERMREGSRVAFLGAVIWTVTATGFSILAARPFLRMFTTDPEVVEIGYRIMLCYVPFFILWTILEHMSRLLNGVGDAIRPAFIIACTVCLFRCVWVFLVMHMTAPTVSHLVISYPITWFLSCIFIGFYLHRHPIYDRKRER